MLIYVPLVWIRNMEKLAFTHIISDILIITVIVAIFTFGTINIANNEGEVFKNDFITSSFYKAIPFSAFAFEGVAVILPLREIVEDKTSYMKIVIFVVAGICVLYIVFSEYMNLAYGKKMKTLTEIFIILSQMSFCTNYVYFITS